MLKKKVEIDQLKVEYEKLHANHMEQIDELKEEKFNVTIDKDVYLKIDDIPVRSDIPKAEALSSPNTTRRITR